MYLQMHDCFIQDSAYLATISHSLANFEVSYHALSCPTEKATWQGTIGDFWRTADKKLEPSFWPFERN